MEKVDKNVIPFANEFNHMSLADIDDLLEWLQDRGFLSEDGEIFRAEFWKLFIKKQNYETKNHQNTISIKQAQRS